MAGDWMPIELHLPTKPEIVTLVSRLRNDINTVVGACVRFWLWANAHTDDGTIDQFTADGVDSVIGIPGFAEALASVGWLEIAADGIKIPHFERHNGKSAKARARNAERQQRHRERNACVTPPSRSRNAKVTLEKRREEKSTKPVSETREAAKPPPVEPEPPPGPFDDPANPIRLIEAVAKRPLRPEESRAIAAEEQRVAHTPEVFVHGQPVAAVDLWRRCLGQLQREPGFALSTVTAALRYVSAMQARCVDQGVWPDEHPRAPARPGGASEPSEAEIDAAIAEGVAMAAAKRNGRRR